jgi:hypothetical protein
MHPTWVLTALCGLLLLPRLSGAQTPGGPRIDADRHQVFQTLEDSQWVRLAGPGLGRREGRVLQHSPTEIVLSPQPQSLRVPATSIDTLWTKGTSSKTGALVGGLLGAGLGVLFATQTVEEGETAGADWVLAIGGGGAVAGGLLGALIGSAFPRWQRRYPR